jgi:polyhydroxybutyrate depolymerase
MVTLFTAFSSFAQAPQEEPEPLPAPPPRAVGQPERPPLSEPEPANVRSPSRPAVPDAPRTAAPQTTAPQAPAAPATETPAQATAQPKKNEKPREKTDAEAVAEYLKKVDPKNDKPISAAERAPKEPGRPSDAPLQQSGVKVQSNPVLGKKMTLKIGDRERTYYVYEPKTLLKPLPVIFAFHGGAGNPRDFARMTNLSGLADSKGFLLVYPEGTGALRTWNAGHCCGFAERNDIDDVAFVRSILMQLARNYKLDGKRIFATGISNGGMMAFRLACEMSETFAAIASVAGINQTPQCQPKRPVSILMMNAVKDKHIPYNGGLPESGLRAGFGRKDVGTPPVQAVIAFWVRYNLCNGQPLKESTESFVLETYNCRNQRRVQLFSLLKGGHSWPGGEKIAPNMDTPLASLPANEIMWKFFTDVTREW